MIVCKDLNKEFDTKEEHIKALKDNKHHIIASKKMQTKQADATYYTLPLYSKESASKEGVNNEDATKLKAKLIINTTKILDSHGDVHFDGIWNKSVKEQKNIYLLQEHKMTFDHIISDNVKAKVETIKWSDLGFKFKGNTQALVFNAEIDKSRNEYMFNQYSKGFVKEHSVGMRYVKIDFAVNSEEKYYRDEKEVWDKYYEEIVNKEDVDAQGYFWAVTEAKIIEGSAVVKGSNYATPTVSVEPSKDTQSNKEAVNSGTSHNSNFYNII